MAKDNNADKRESRLLSEEIRDLSRENYDIVKNTYDIHRDLTKELLEQNTALGTQKGLSQEINNVVKNSVSQGNDLTKTLKEQVKQSEKLRDNFNGIGDGMFDVLQVMSKELGGKKFSSFFGDAAGALKKAKKDAGGVPLTFSKGFKALGPIIKKSLGPLSIAIAAAQVIKTFVDAAFEASRQTADLTRNQLISRDLAKEMYIKTLPNIRNEYNKANHAAGIQGTILRTDILNAQKSINEELGFQFNLLGRNNNLLEQSVAEVAKMVKHMGLSQQTASRLFLESQRNNVSLQEQNKELAGNLALMSAQEGVMVDVKKVINEAASITGRLRANFNFSVKELAKAVFESKLLGLSLSQVDKVAGGLLDFQSSIRAEMEAEVLLGKELNLEQARFFALTNQTDKLAQELGKTFKSIGGFSKLNRIEQEAFASAMGMSVDELADMEQKQLDIAILRNKQRKIARDLQDKGVKVLKDELDLTKASFSEIKAYYEAANVSQEELIEILGKEAYQRNE